MFQLYTIHFIVFLGIKKETLKLHFHNFWVLSRIISRYIHLNNCWWDGASHLTQYSTATRSMSFVKILAKWEGIIFFIIIIILPSRYNLWRRNFRIARQKYHFNNNCNAWTLYHIAMRCWHFDVMSWMAGRSFGGLNSSSSTELVNRIPAAKKRN